MGQYGYVTAIDAHELGIPMVELGKLAARGQIRHVAYGLYRFDDLPPTRYDPFFEAVVRVGGDTHLTGDAVLAARIGSLPLWRERQCRAGRDRTVHHRGAARPRARPGARHRPLHRVNSTADNVARGDRSWLEVLDRLDGAMTHGLRRFRGRKIKNLGDGIMATFDGPARAISCAHHIRRAAADLRLEMRIGLHTGECQMTGGDLYGVAVTIALRVASLAHGGEILVSSTVRDLVAGSAITFDDRGSQQLKGIPEEWRLFAVADVSG